MKKTLTVLVLFIALIPLLSYGQNNQKNTYSDQFIRDCIVEVFQDQADDLVFNSSSVRFQYLTDFMKKQVVVEYRPEYSGKIFESTSDLKLNNKYNINMQKDDSYNESTFNPLKYELSMNPLNKKIYRISSTDYILIINPKN